MPKQQENTIGSVYNRLGDLDWSSGQFEISPFSCWITYHRHFSDKFDDNATKSPKSKAEPARAIVMNKSSIPPAYNRAEGKTLLAMGAVEVWRT